MLGFIIIRDKQAWKKDIPLLLLREKILSTLSEFHMSVVSICCERPWINVMNWDDFLNEEEFELWFKKKYNRGKRKKEISQLWEEAEASIGEDQAQGAPNPNVAGRVCTVCEDADTSDLHDSHVPKGRSPWLLLWSYLVSADVGPSCPGRACSKMESFKTFVGKSALENFKRGGNRAHFS